MGFPGFRWPGLHSINHHESTGNAERLGGTGAICLEKSGRDEPLTPTEQLRHLLLRLSEHWPRYRTFDWQPAVPWTNNGTERVIGRMKMRSRTVRGYKTEPGLLNGLMLAGSWVA